MRWVQALGAWGAHTQRCSGGGSCRCKGRDPAGREARGWTCPEPNRPPIPGPHCPASSQPPGSCEVAPWGLVRASLSGPASGSMWRRPSREGEKRGGQGSCLEAPRGLSGRTPPLPQAGNVLLLSPLPCQPAPLSSCSDPPGKPKSPPTVCRSLQRGTGRWKDRHEQQEGGR